MTATREPPSARSTTPPGRQSGTALPDHSRFPALDGLRAVAVGAVALTHAAFNTGRYVRGPGSSALAHLDIGVAIFFVISGFLLSREFFVAHLRGRATLSTTAYLWRRALRILPMYWVAVALAMLLVPENRHASTADWLRHLGLVQIYHAGWLRNGITQAWSLCTEAAFYVLLPVIAAIVLWFAARYSIGAAAVTCAAVMTSVCIAWIIWYHVSGLPAFATAGFWLPTYLSWFAAGIGMAGIHTALAQGSTRWTWARDLGTQPGVCWVFAGAMYMIIVTPMTGALSIEPAGAAPAVVRNVTYMLFAAAVVWPAVFGQGALVRGVLANRPMRFLGDISYSVFLLHMMLLQAAIAVLGYPAWTGSTFSAFFATLVLTIPAAALSYRLIERPAMRLRRLVPARRAPKEAHREASGEDGVAAAR